MNRPRSAWPFIHGQLGCFHPAAVVGHARHSEHECKHLLLGPCLQLLSISPDAEVGPLDRMVFCFEFSEEPPCCVPRWLPQFTLPPAGPGAPGIGLLGFFSFLLLLLLFFFFCCVLGVLCVILEICFSKISSQSVSVLL